MSKAVAKDTLLRQVAELEKTVRGMNEPKKLQIFHEHRLPLDACMGGTNLNMVDDFRHYAKRDMVIKLADELIRTGVVKFEETLHDDHQRWSKTLTVKAELFVC